MSQRRGHGEGSIVERRGADGKVRRYVAELMVGYRLDGKKEVWRRSYPTRDEAKAGLARAILDQQKGQLVVSARRSVEDYLAYWVKTVEASLEAKTWVEYKRYAEQVLTPALGRHQLARLKPTMIQALYSQLLAAGRSARWVRLCHAVLHKALADAVRWQLLESNPADRVTKPKEERRAWQIWTPAQVGVFLQALAGDPDLELYVVAILSQCRAGELCALQWPSVDWDRSQVTICRSVTRVGTRGLVVKETPKTASGRRTIVLPEAAMAALRRQRARVAEWQQRAGAGWPAGDLVFPKRDGGIRDATAARQKLQKRAEALGLPVLRFHDLRHLGASLLLALGTPAKTVQGRLGHSSIQVTMDTYGHLLPGADRSAAEALGKLLGQHGLGGGEAEPG